VETFASVAVASSDAVERYVLNQEEPYSNEEREALEQNLTILCPHRPAVGYSLDDLKVISPSLCMHKINLKEDAKPVVDYQHRLHQKMKKVARKEVIKLKEAGIIYPIHDSKWVSHVHCVPKKGGTTVVPNNENELVSQCTVTGY
jgi:hypothetical protein